MKTQISASFVPMQMSHYFGKWKCGCCEMATCHVSHRPVCEPRLHAVHAGLHGDFSLRFVLPVLLVTQQEETAQLLAPRWQQGCKENTMTHTHTCTHISLHWSYAACSCFIKFMFTVLCVNTEIHKNLLFCRCSPQRNTFIPTGVQIFCCTELSVCFQILQGAA